MLWECSECGEPTAMRRRVCQHVLDRLDASEAQKVGVGIVRRAIEEPLRQIAGNAGVEGSIVIERVREQPVGHGFNARTLNYEDLMTAGVIDPTKVVRSALQHAASVSGLMLTTEALIAEQPNKAAPTSASAHPAPGMDF